MAWHLRHRRDSSKLFNGGPAPEPAMAHHNPAHGTRNLSAVSARGRCQPSRLLHLTLQLNANPIQRLALAQMAQIVLMLPPASPCVPVLPRNLQAADLSRFARRGHHLNLLLVLCASPGALRCWQAQYFAEVCCAAACPLFTNVCSAAAAATCRGTSSPCISWSTTYKS